jgi:hypothetical protein
MWPEDSKIPYSSWSTSGLPEVHYYTDTTPVVDCTGFIEKYDVMPRIDWDKILLGRNTMKEKTPEIKETKEQKIYLERSDSYDRAIISGDRLEPTDVFRLVDDEFRKIYMVIDTSDVIDETSVDESVIYVLDIATAKVVAMDKDIKAYVYDPESVKFRTGEFVKGYGKKEIDV